MPNVFGGSHVAYIQMVAVVGEHTKLMLTHNENRSIIPYVCESAHVLLGTNLLGTNLLGPSLSPCIHLSQFVAPLTLIVNHVFQYRQKRGIWGAPLKFMTSLSLPQPGWSFGAIISTT